MGDSIVVNVTRQSIVSHDSPDSAVSVSTPGPAGPAGPQGPAGTSGGTRIEESFTSTSVVVVGHNLGYEPITSVIIGGEEVEADVTHNSINQLTVTFAAPQTGKVVCV